MFGKHVANQQSTRPSQRDTLFQDCVMDEIDKLSAAREACANILPQIALNLSVQAEICRKSAEIIHVDMANKVKREEIYKERKKQKRRERMNRRAEITADEQCKLDETRLARHDTICDNFRRLVYSQTEHRQPLSYEWQRSIMDQWTMREWLENVRVTRDVFEYLLARVRLRLISRDHSTGGKRCTPEWCQLASTLSWLGGGRACDIREKYGMRKATFYLVLRVTTTALYEELREEFVKFPTTAAECEANSFAFERYCHFTGCIGAVDGIVIPVQLLDKRMAKVMYCPRKDCYGINVQAICNHKCEFLFVDSSNYASTHDGRAFKETTTWSELEEGFLTFQNSVPRGFFFLLGDNAYSLRDFLLHPWKGKPIEGGPADAFNFYLSAARCTIERSFGQLVQVWQRLKKGIKLRRIEDVIQTILVCFVLHNVRKHFSCPFVSTTRTPFADGSIGPRCSSVDDDIQDSIREWIIEHCDNTVGSRLPVDRTSVAVRNTALGKELRQEIAYSLLRRGFIRPGSVAQHNSRCPDERADDIEGLI